MGDEHLVAASHRQRLHAVGDAQLRQPQADQPGVAIHHLRCVHQPLAVGLILPVAEGPRLAEQPPYAEAADGFGVFLFVALLHADVEVGHAKLFVGEVGDQQVVVGGAGHYQHRADLLRVGHLHEQRVEGISGHRDMPQPLGDGDDGGVEIEITHLAALCQRASKLQPHLAAADDQYAVFIAAGDLKSLAHRLGNQAVEHHR